MPDLFVRNRWLALVMAGVTFVLLVGGFAYTVANGTRDSIISAGVDNLVVGGTFAAVGLLLAWRVPQNPVGWLFTFGGLMWGLGALGGSPQQLYASGQRSFSTWQRVELAGFGWPLVIVPCIQLPLLFLPEGRLRSRRWRVAAWAATVSMVTTSVALAITPGDIEGFPGVTNPLGVAGSTAIDTVVVITGAVVLFLCVVAAMVGLVLRYRAAQGVARQQLRWVALGPAIVAPGIALGAVTTGVAGELIALVFTAVPITIAVAVLRYRLYDLGRIISRTVTYAALTASLAGVYVGIVALGATLSGGSGPSVAVATLATAALFRPLRSRLQAIVDRRFNRARYDATATVDAFSTRLRGQLAVEAVRSDLLATVTRVVEPASASLWTPGRPSLTELRRVR